MGRGWSEMKEQYPAYGNEAQDGLLLKYEYEDIWDQARLSTRNTCSTCMSMYGSINASCPPK